MRFLNKINPPARVVLSLGIILIVYGYLCRVAGIYFFWESLSIGWDVFFIGLLLSLISIRKFQKLSGKKTVGENIGIGFLIFILVVQTIFYFSVKNSDAYKAARDYILHDPSLSSETGAIDDLVLFPAGSFSMDGNRGSAELSITVKGNRKFKELRLYLAKESDAGWKVVACR